MKAIDQLAAALRDIAPGRHLCHACKRVTEWRGGRNGAQRCQDCGGRFPCRSRDCGHEDCGRARQVKP